MKILIAEDDDNKRAQVVEFLRSRGLSDIVETRSFQTTMLNLTQGAFDVVLLDMSMPTFDIDTNEDGGRPQKFAGREILRQMARRRIPASVIVVTQFDRFTEGGRTLTLPELAEELAAAFRPVYVGAVYYETASERWKRELELLINAIRRGGA